MSSDEDSEVGHDSHFAGSTPYRVQSSKAILHLTRESNAFFNIERGVGTYLTCELTESFRLVHVAKKFHGLPALAVADDQSILQHQISRPEWHSCHQQAVVTIDRNEYEDLQDPTLVLSAPNHKIDGKILIKKHKGWNGSRTCRAHAVKSSGFLLGAPSSAYAIPIESDPKMKWQVRRSWIPHSGNIFP